MFLKVVGLRNVNKEQLLMMGHFYDSYKVNDDSFYFKFSSFLMRNGLRVKMICLLSEYFYTINEHFDLTSLNFSWYTSFQNTNLYYFITERFLDQFALYDLNLIIKKIRTSRKVRKYSKGKFRYQSRLILLRERQIFGSILRLWKICYNSCGEEGDNLRQRIIASFFLVDESLAPETTPQKIQETMLDLYIKQMSNSRK